MKLYEINDAIMTLLSSLTVDEETGEIPADIDDVIAQIDSLTEDRKSILEYLAKEVLNLRAEQTAIKSEETRLKERREHLAKREQSIINVLDRECKGEKTDLGVATVSYRQSESVERDPDSNIHLITLWLAERRHFDCYKDPDPVLDKVALKKLIKSGVEVPGIRITKHTNCSLK